MSNRLTGYDLVAALSENAINAQLMRLWQINILPSTWSVSFGSFFDNGTLSVTDFGAPQVLFSASDSTYHDVILVLTLNAGTLTANSVTLPFTNWKFAFKTDMALAPLDDPDLQARISKGTTPQAVADSIKSAGLDLDKVFSISHLFMDFENANLAEFDTANTSFDLSGVPESQRADTQTQLINCLTKYFQSLAGTSNPYILGYPLQVSDPAPSTPNAAPTYVPISVNFTSTPSQKGLGTLNFLFMTQGNAPTSPTAGIFQVPWLTDDSQDGVFALDSRLLIDQLIPPLTAPFGGFPVSSFTFGGLTASDPLSSIVSTGTQGYSIKGAKVTAGDLKGGTIDISIAPVNNSQGGSIGVQVPFGSQPAVGYTNQLRVDYSYRLTKEVKAMKFIPTGSYTMTSTWSATFNFAVDDHGVVSANLGGVTQPDTKVDSKKEWWSYILDAFPVVGIADMVANIQTMKDFPNVKDGSWQVSQSKLTLVMPAGDIFLFKGAVFDGEIDLLVDITYNT